MTIPNPMPGLEGAQRFTNVEIGDVKTSKFFFSLNHYYDADIYGTLSVGTDQKVLPGCNVTVKKSGTLKISSKVIFVENLEEVASGAKKAYKYPTIYNQKTNSGSVLNALHVEGSLVVDGSSAAIGGKIYSSTVDASVDLLSANSTNVTYKEGANGERGGFKGTQFYLTYQDPVQSENARGPVLSGSSVSVSDFTKSMYVYTQEGSNIGWKAATDLDTFNVTFHLNGGSTSYADGYKKDFYLKKGETKTITSISMEEPTKSYYTFEGWYLDDSFAIPLSSGVEVKNGTVLNLYAKYGLTKYQVTYNIQNASDIEADIVDPNTLTQFTYTDFVNNGSSYHIEDATSNIPEQIMFDGWYTDPSYSIDSKLSGNNITECKNYDLYGRFVKVRPKIRIEGVYLEGKNVFAVDENGKLPAEVISAINQTISESKKDVNDSKYITGLSLTQNGSPISASSYVFTDNQTLFLLKNDKSVVNYVLDSNTTLKKYFVRDDVTGNIFGNVKPVFDLDTDLNSNSTYTNKQERHVYKWKIGEKILANVSSTETEQDVSAYINSTSESSYSFDPFWAYRLIIDVKSSGDENAKITCNCVGENNNLNNYELKAGDNLTRYLVPQTSIKIVIHNYYSFFGSGHKTKITSTGIDMNGSNSGNGNISSLRGDWSIEKNMPNNAVIIAITKG